MRQSIRTNLILSLLLLVSVAALYGQFLWNPIVFDDMPFFLLDNAGNQPVSGYRFSPLELRSLPYATLAWTKLFFGLDLINFRVGNLVLHVGVVVALFFFLSLLFATLLGTPTKGRIGPRHAAFFAALLFALHPIATYAVGYLVQRTILMATLFALLAMWSYAHGSINSKPWSLWLTVPLYYLAVFSKEHAIMLPTALLALTVLLHPDWRSKLKQRWGIFLSLAAVAFFVVLAKRGVLGSTYEPGAAEMLLGEQGKLAYPLSVITQTGLFFKYAALWVLPNPTWTSIDMREPFAPGVISIYLLWAALYLAWGLLAFWLLTQRGKMGLAGFALLFPWLMFLTEFSSVRIQEVFVLYRSYLWAVGACCLLPIVFSRLSVRVSAFILTSIAAAMFVISMERLMVMSELVFLWDDAAKLVKGHDELPGVYRIYYNRGTAYVTLGMLDNAIPDFEKTIALNKSMPEGPHNLGVVYAGKRDFPKAIAAFQQAIALATKNRMYYLQAHGNLGSAYLQSGETIKAIAEFGQAIEIAHVQRTATAFPYYIGRAEAYEKLGEFQKSQADYKEACTRAKKGCDKLVASNVTPVK